MSQTIRILYIEHHEKAAVDFIRTLEPFKYAINIAQSGFEGLQLYNIRAYDLVVLTYDVPDQNCLHIINRIQENPSPPAILILTPNDGNGVKLAVEALGLGANDYLAKDRHGDYLSLLPLLVRNILRRQQVEQDRLDMLFTLQSRNNALNSLNSIANELTSILEPNQVIERLMRAAIDLLNAEGGSLWLWEDNNKQKMVVCQAVIHRAGTPPLIGIRKKRGEGIVGWVAERGRSTILQRAETDDRFQRDVDAQINFTTRSLMAVPLRVRSEVTGVLEFVNKLTGNFDNDDLSLAETLAASASTALENARLVNTLRRHTIDLQERNAELDAFGHTVAHDLQNMLARVVGFAEYLVMESTEDESDLSQETVLHAANIIARSGRKMGTVIDALMLLSAVREAKVEYETIDTEYILSEVLDRLSDQIEGAKANIDLPDEWPQAYGYGAWVEEVWYNYIGNALKYGGSPPQITLGADMDAQTDHVRFWVQDSGAGISKEDQEQLFRPFTDLGRARTRGYGLGLSIVERIVRKMGGDVSVESEEGKGSRFFFTLPRLMTQKRMVSSKPIAGSRVNG